MHLLSHKCNKYNFLSLNDAQNITQEQIPFLILYLPEDQVVSSDQGVEVSE